MPPLKSRNLPSDVRVALPSDVRADGPNLPSDVRADGPQNLPSDVRVLLRKFLPGWQPYSPLENGAAGPAAEVLPLRRPTRDELAGLTGLANRNDAPTRRIDAMRLTHRNKQNTEAANGDHWRTTTEY